MIRLRIWASGATVAFAVACVATSPRAASPSSRPPQRASARVVRVVIASASRVSLSATGNWRLDEGDGASALARGGRDDVWTVERDGARLRARRPDGASTPARMGPFVARAVGEGAFLTVGGKRYRGEVTLLPTDSGVVAINKLPIEEYLRGVVPLEIGKRALEEQAAVEAQAVAARSYTYAHVQADPRQPSDMGATTIDQVYGGMDAETPLGDVAVQSTAGLVLTYGGRIASAPYSSTCGGSTASASEIWHSGDEPYLRAVSDRVPGTERYYCDPSPRFAWTRTLDRATLAAALARYLGTYAPVPAGGVGAVRSVSVESRTASGRVRNLVVVTDRGRYMLRGNDIRFVLRAPGGEILNSTYFSVETEAGADREVRRVTVTGHGNGHAVGMCQWGAIGRARAGQDFRTILRTYYPGTAVEVVD